MRQNPDRRLSLPGLTACLVSAAGLVACDSGQGRSANAAAFGGLEAQVCSGVPVADARCYRVTVPESRSAPARTIPLRIVVLPVTGTERAADPVFFLAGGPGQAASDVLREQAITSSGIRARRELVFADQRGTGGSNPLTCHFYGPPEDTQSYFDKFLPLDKVRACRETVAKGADISQYTTQASVDDLEAIRVAMGLSRINLLGGSYGTRLAMEYLRRYGRHVRAVILESPVTPRTHAPEAFGRLAERALQGLIAECAADEPCAKAFPGLASEAESLFERLRGTPVTATVSHPARRSPVPVRLTRDHVAEAIRYMMYSAHGASRVPLYLHEAFNGNYTPIASFLIRWRAEGTFDGLYLSITCAEDVPFVAKDAAERDDPTYLGGYRVRQQRAACGEWPVGTASEQQFQPVTTAVPVLMISGELDPVTPPSNADELARTLRNSVHVRIPSSGHSPAGLAGLDCLEEIKRVFIERGSADGLNTSCVSRIRRPGFITSR